MADAPRTESVQTTVKIDLSSLSSDKATVKACDAAFKLTKMAGRPGATKAAHEYFTKNVAKIRAAGSKKVVVGPLDLIVEESDDEKMREEPAAKPTAGDEPTKASGKFSDYTDQEIGIG